MNSKNIARTIVRTGHFYIAAPDLFSLGRFDEIAALIPFKCSLEQDYFREGDWVIVCKDILEDRHSCFWHGQGCDSSVEVSNPTQWMDAWQHEQNPTWRK